ncbi:MAG: hypothetical protein U0401_03425 [Anaerolineae bacterium]
MEVSDEDADQALARLQEQRATWVPVERLAQLGDLISMTVTEQMGRPFYPTIRPWSTTQSSAGRATR